MFLGENEVEQNTTKALQLAAICEYPDAVWLTKLVAGRDYDDFEEVFLECEDDRRALCFAGILIYTWDNCETVRRAAELGTNWKNNCFF